jgi:K+-transporting ATPase KdpF subunit
MNFEIVSGLVLTAVLLVYLFYALLNPEKL